MAIEKIYPNQDLANSNWTNNLGGSTQLWRAIDEGTDAPNHGDYINTFNPSNYYRMGFTNPTPDNQRVTEVLFRFTACHKQNPIGFNFAINMSLYLNGVWQCDLGYVWIGAAPNWTYGFLSKACDMSKAQANDLQLHLWASGVNWAPGPFGDWVAVSALQCELTVVPAHKIFLPESPMLPVVNGETSPMKTTVNASESSMLASVNLAQATIPNELPLTEAEMPATVTLEESKFE